MAFHELTGELKGAVHESPALVEVYILSPEAPAASLVPSAEDARQFQFLTSVEFVCHVVPVLVEV